MQLIHEASVDEVPTVWEALDFVDRADRQRLFNAVLHCVASGGGFGVEVTITTATGLRRRIQVSGFHASPPGDERAIVQGSVAVLHDEPPVKDDPRAAARIQAQLRGWELFAAAVPHELKSPLGIARGYAQAAREALELEPGGRPQLYFDRLQNSLANLEGLLDSLLTFALLGARPVSMRDVDLSSIASACLRTLYEAEPSRNVSVDVQPGLVARCDPDLLRLVLSNLLGNAWKFTREAADARVWVHAEQRGPATVFCVSDNGAGFDMNDAPRLFKPFERLHDQRDFQGSGVGLALVRKVVEWHGGSVWANSAPGLGAEFCFTLPGYGAN